MLLDGTTPGRTVPLHAQISYVNEKACDAWLVIRTRFVLPASQLWGRPLAYGVVAVARSSLIWRALGAFAAFRPDVCVEIFSVVVVEKFLARLDGAFGYDINAPPPYFYFAVWPA